MSVALVPRRRRARRQALLRVPLVTAALLALVALVVAALLAVVRDGGRDAPVAPGRLLQLQQYTDPKTVATKGPSSSTGVDPAQIKMASSPELDDFLREALSSCSVPKGDYGVLDDSSVPASS